MSELPRPHYVVDPDFPRAPPQRVWNAMSAEERARVVRELPVHLPEHLMPPPPGDDHYEATMEGREALRGYFARAETPLYVSGELAVYYPDETPFYPDLFAVRDVATHKRDTWVVSEEGRGLDWILEVLVAGNRRKDLEQNVLRYARLGVTEYFIFEPRARRLRGYRLTAPGVAMYESLVSYDGTFVSKVLGLDLLALPNGHLRFRRGDDDLLVPQEIIDRLEAFSEEATAAAEEAAIRIEEEQERTEAERQRAEAERQRAEAERQRAEVAEARAASAEDRVRALEEKLRKAQGAAGVKKPRRTQGR